MAMAIGDSVTVSMSAEMIGRRSWSRSCELRVEIRVARDDLAVERRERHVVVREGDASVRGEKLVGRLIELVVE